MDHRLGPHPAHETCAKGEGRHEDGRRQGEADPGRQRPPKAGAAQAEREADLARRRAGQELAQRHQIGKGGLVQPLAAADKGFPEIAEVSDGPAERRQAKLQKGDKNFARIAPPDFAPFDHLKAVPT